MSKVPGSAQVDLVEHDVFSATERVAAPRDGARDDGVEVEDEALAPSEIVVVERRQLVRDAVARGFAASLSWRVQSYPTIGQCLAAPNNWSRTVIVHLALGEDGGSSIDEAFGAMHKAECPAALMILSDCDAAASVVDAFKKGAKGYLPMSVPVRIAAQAIRLVAAGGCYVPVSCLVGGQGALELARADGPSTAKAADERSCIFTARQTAVIEALRRGKANKVIAYELNMRESTVKVHVRNIMKKLNARNRTEVAYRANEFLELRR